MPKIWYITLYKYGNLEINFLTLTSHVMFKYRLAVSDSLELILSCLKFNIEQN